MLKSHRKENSSREKRYITRNTADLVCSQRIGKQEKTHFERFLRRKWLRQRSTKYNTRPLRNHTYVTNLRQHKWHREKTEHTSDVPHSNAFLSLMHPTTACPQVYLSVGGTKYRTGVNALFILTWRRGGRDQEGGSLKKRPPHCTRLRLKLAIPQTWETRAHNFC